MGNRGRQLSHCCQAIRVRQCHVYFEVAAFAVTHRLFRSFAFSQIHDKRDALVLPPFEARAAEQHGHATAVLAEPLTLERLQAPGHFELSYTLLDGVAPFRRYQLPPSHATPDQILAAVADHAQKSGISFNDSDCILEFKYDDPDDAGVDQAPNPRFPFLKLSIETEVRQ